MTDPDDRHPDDFRPRNIPDPAEFLRRTDPNAGLVAALNGLLAQLDTLDDLLADIRAIMDNRPPRRRLF